MRVGRRPSSSIPAGFCRLVQEDKWTFDANAGPILLKTKMFALFHPLQPLRFRRQDAANLSRLQKGKSLTERDASFKVFYAFFFFLFRTLGSEQELSKYIFFSIVVHRCKKPLFTSEGCQQTDHLLLTRCVQTGVASVGVQVCHRRTNRRGQLKKPRHTCAHN